MVSNMANPNPRCSEELIDNKDELINIAFVYGAGFYRNHVERLQTSRRQLNEKGSSLVLELLSQIEEDDLPNGILEDSKLVNYIYNCMVPLRPKELQESDTTVDLDLFFQYASDHELQVIGRWVTKIEEKQLDDIKEDERVCAICLEDLGGANSITSLYCKHVFHPSCIHSWSFKKACCSCPLCRFPFAGFFDDEEEIVFVCKWREKQFLVKTPTNMNFFDMRMSQRPD